MSTVDSRMRGFEKKGCLKRGGKNSRCEKAVKESTFRGVGGLLMYERVRKGFGCM